MSLKNLDLYIHIYIFAVNYTFRKIYSTNNKMKKFNFLTALLCVLICVCCTNNDDNMDIIKGGSRISASISEQTRTTLGEDNSVLWSEGDQIVVFTGSYGNVFELKYGAGTSNGEFWSDVDMPDALEYFALYPFSMYNTAFFVENKVSYLINLPYNTVFAEKNFVTNSNPMYGISTDKNHIEFKNLCGIVEFQIVGQGTVKSISITSTENKRLSGMFTIDPLSLELAPYANCSSTVGATLDSPITLSQTPRSIYAILPPATYTGLSVTTTDEWGVQTTLTAKNPITVTRSQITTVSKFTHNGCDIITDKPSIFISKLGSCIAGVSYSIHCNQHCLGYKYSKLPMEIYENLREKGLSDIDIFSSHQSVILSEPCPDTHNGILFAMPVDKDGNDYTEGFVVENLFGDSIPYDDTITVSISDIEIGENSFAATLNSNISNVIFINSWIGATTGRPASQEIPLALCQRGWSYHTPSNNGSARISSPDDTWLYPDVEYFFYYSATDAVVDTDAYICYKDLHTDFYTRYAPMAKYTFRTKAHIPSAATVEFTNADIGETTASFDVVLSEGSTKWKYYISDSNAEFQYASDTEIADYRLSGPNDGVVSQESQVYFSNLKYDTKYYVYAIAYDSNDSYGALFKYEFTTTPLKEIDDHRYDQYLGTYLATPNGTTVPRTVTISQDVKGRTYKITGLGDPALIGIYDDTIQAYFYDGVLSIPCQTVPDTLSVYLNNAYYYWYNEDYGLNGTYEPGKITFSTDDSWNATVWTGIILVQPTSSSYYTNLVLTRK